VIVDKNQTLLFLKIHQAHSILDMQEVIALIQQLKCGGIYTANVSSYVKKHRTTGAGSFPVKGEAWATSPFQDSLLQANRTSIDMDRLVRPQMQ
jgi:hypothetical protein